MSANRNSDTYRASPAALFREMDDGAVILDLEKGVYFGLDLLGTRIWQLMGQGCNFEEIVNQLLAEYEVDRATVEGDLEKLALDLEKRGLVQKS